MGLLPLLLSWTAALASAPDAKSLVYDIQVGETTVGTRTTTVRAQDVDGAPGRMIESFTDISAQIGPVTFTYRQRLTAFATRAPASFHAVINENGEPHEVQARWNGGGWMVTIVDRGGIRTVDHPAERVDLSTVDLIDPETHYQIGRYAHVKVLSAETGDLWEGAVEPLGPSSIPIGGQAVQVDGVAWLSPEGRTEFWYDSEGYLVQYNMRLLGYRVQGKLREPPPPGPDEFRVGLGTIKVDEREL
jgi:hypothetical protein